MNQQPDQKPDLDLLINFAHRGCVEATVEAQRRLALLDTYEDKAVLHPVLHNFSPELHRHELSAEVHRKNLLQTLADAERVGLLCEKYNNTRSAEGLEGLFDFLKHRHPRKDTAKK